MVIGTVFNANLNADKIYIDLKYLSDPIEHTFFLTIKNQSLSTLYFKLICDIPNWSITSPTDGKLGSIASNSSSTITITISRANPNTEVTELGNLIVEAYTDSEYTNKIGEAQLPVEIYIEDLESWEDVEIYDFNDGTSQGWTLGNMSIVNDLSVEAGGYSARCYGYGNMYPYLEKSITLPNKNKVRVALFIAVKHDGKGQISADSHFKNISIQVNDEKVFDIPYTFKSFYGKGVYTWGWYKIVADLSKYKNQTVTLKISFTISCYTYSRAYAWIDRIVIAGKD